MKFTGSFECAWCGADLKEDILDQAMEKLWEEDEIEPLLNVSCCKCEGEVRVDISMTLEVSTEKDENQPPPPVVRFQDFGAARNTITPITLFRGQTISQSFFELTDEGYCRISIAWRFGHEQEERPDVVVRHTYIEEQDCDGVMDIHREHTATFDELDTYHAKYSDVWVPSWELVEENVTDPQAEAAGY